MKQNNKIVVGILIFDQVEVLDVTGPFEVFSVTRTNENRRREESSPFRVLLVSEDTKRVTAVGGLVFTPDTTIHNCPDLDLLIVPGGWGTRTEISNKMIIEWIADRAYKTRLTASVCTGSSLLGRAGLLNGREATTHWQAFDFLRESAPAVKIREDVRFTTAPPIFTSAGISSGIDLALKIVSYFLGIEIGKATAKHMEYPYPESDLRIVTRKS
ncbi:MAG TPA: DJ-1/PfpI family protein [Nitrososphaeraceae archaeon]